MAQACVEAASRCLPVFASCLAIKHVFSSDLVRLENAFRCCQSRTQNKSSSLSYSLPSGIEGKGGFSGTREKNTTDMPGEECRCRRWLWQQLHSLRPSDSHFMVMLLLYASASASTESRWLGDEKTCIGRERPSSKTRVLSDGSCHYQEADVCHRSAADREDCWRPISDHVVAQNELRRQTLKRRSQSGGQHGPESGLVALRETYEGRQWHCLLLGRREDACMPHCCANIQIQTLAVIAGIVSRRMKGDACPIYVYMSDPREN